LTTAWRHTGAAAFPGEMTREYRCQNCGAKYTLRARARIITLWMVGGLLTLFTLLFGLPFLYFAYRAGREESRIPLVPDAPMPERRFPDGPPVRICGACGAPAVAVKVTRNRTNGLPSGIEYDYCCSSCQREFTVESLWGQLLTTLSALVVAGIAAAFWFVAESPGWRYGGTVVTGLLALLVLVQVVKRFVARLQNRTA